MTENSRRVSGTREKNMKTLWENRGVVWIHCIGISYFEKKLVWLAKPCTPSKVSGRKKMIVSWKIFGASRRGGEGGAVRSFQREEKLTSWFTHPCVQQQYIFHESESWLQRETFLYIFRYCFENDVDITPREWLRACSFVQSRSFSDRKVPQLALNLAKKGTGVGK